MRSAPPRRRRRSTRRRDAWGGELVIAISVLLVLASAVGLLGGRDESSQVPTAARESDLPSSKKGSEGGSSQPAPRPAPVAAAAAPDRGVCPRRADELLSGMSDDEKVGQMVMPSVALGSDGEVSSETRSLIEDYHAGAFVVLEESDPISAARHNDQLQRWAAAAGEGIPLLIGADFEFGAPQTVQDGATALPLEMALGADGDPRDAEAAARLGAEEARAMGFNWLFAPVADVSASLNPVIGVRSFGADPELVSTLVAEQVRAYEAAGVIAAPKHFPGHGATAADSHSALPHVEEDLATLERVHLAPFRAAVDAGADAIMTGHLVIEAIDPSRPATLSRDVVTGLLRDDMGYDGLVVTDAMDMAAIDRRWSVQEAAVTAVQAGVDVILSPGTYEDHVGRIRALAGALATGELTRERVDESVRRILTVKCEYGLLDESSAASDPSTVGSPEHLAEARELAVDGITMLENDGALPLATGRDATILFAGVMDVTPMARRAEELTDAEILAWQSNGDNPTSAEIREATELARAADAVVVSTYSAGEPAFGQVQLVNALIGTRKPVIAVSLGMPNDIASYPDVDAYLASYARAAWPHANPTAVEAAADVLFGKDPGGRLPVDIGGAYPIGRGLDY